MKKVRIKGFTLIELLATVIILAIVLLIAVPQVLKVIEKTRKNAFAADAIVAAKEAVNKLNTDYINSNGVLPIEGESIPVSIEDLNNKDLDKYTGEVIVKREDGKLIPYVSMTDNTYYICNIKNEDINASSVTHDSECSIFDFTLEEPETPEDPVIIVTENEPVLATGMTPVKWSGTTMVTTTVDDTDWFDYSITSKKWANVQTADGSLWVWIPRYAYKITSGYHSETSGTIEVKFLNGKTNTAYDGTTAEAVNQGNNPGSDTKFVTHPAFKFGDDELTGIWIAKFEASNNEGKVASVPNVTSWRSITTSQMFDYARSMETNSSYGWGTTGNDIDTHMLKDVEWGAVTYLSWSTYGKNSEIWINNSSTYITGCGANSVSESSFSDCQNEYNTPTGANASTTGNYYGIYDMSGGANDRTASYLIGGGSDLASYGASLLSADFKYKDQYIGDSSTSQTNYDLNTGYYGNAMYETSSQSSGLKSWNADYSGFVNSTASFYLRGGSYSNKTDAGSFYFGAALGRAATNSSFRSTVVVQAGL